ncbi:MAG: hypothetical protein NTU73_06265 [Ignavibacteriae bacterium]|nr:hypothetical protein [Ignavibacteriota bacterium]
MNNEPRLNFADKYGQTDKELATALGEDETDSGFSELMINLGYFWSELYERWFLKTNSAYTKEEQELADYLYNLKFK